MKLNQISEGLAARTRRERIKLPGKKWVVFDSVSKTFAGRGGDRDSRTTKAANAAIFASKAKADEKAEAMNWWWKEHKREEWQYGQELDHAQAETDFDTWFKGQLSLARDFRRGHSLHPDSEYRMFFAPVRDKVKIQKAYKEFLAKAKRRWKKAEKKGPPPSAEFGARPVTIIYEIG